MASLLESLGRCAWDLSWQATLLVAVGLAASFVWRAAASRAHLALAMALIAAIVTPICTAAVRGLGLGLWPAPMLAAPSSGTRVDDAGTRQTAAGARRTLTDMSLERPSAVVGRSSPEALREAVALIPNERAIAAEASADRPAATAPPSARPRWTLSWNAVRLVLLSTWGALTLVGAIRLARSCSASLRILARARPIGDELVTRLLADAAARIGVRAPALAFASDDVACPAIWCWGVRPRVLLPAASVALFRDDARCESLRGIVCHELAHWKRLDHQTSLLSHIACCLLPWHPLVYWSRRRLDELSERACDEWVVASGHTAIDYAESLLQLVPQRRGTLALAAVTRRSSLARRVQHLVAGSHATPAIGWCWTSVAASLAVALVATCALSQQRALAVDDKSTETIERAQAKQAPAEPVEAASKHGARLQTITVSGTVRDDHDAPITDARVYLVGHQLTWDGDPKTLVFGGQEMVTLAASTTDEDGRFTMSVERDPAQFMSLTVVAKADLLGISGTHIPKQGDTFGAGDLAIVFKEEEPIAGQLLSVSGNPVTGATVSLERLSMLGLDLDMSHKTSAAADDAGHAFWPPPVTTDSAGKFTIAGLPKGCVARLLISSHGNSPHAITVGGQANQARSGENNLPTRFTYVLEPPRVIEGKVVDRRSGAPIPGIEVAISGIMYGSGGGHIGVTAKSGPDGAYRVLVPAFDLYIVAAFPDLGHFRYLRNIQGSAVASQNTANGASHLDVRLGPGKIVRGRVVDRATGEPVIGASVAYLRGRDSRRLNSNDYPEGARTLTDANGEYAVTALADRGAITVESRSSEYVRTAFASASGYWNAPVASHGSIEIVVPADAAEPWQAPDIPLGRGIAFELALTGPDGARVPTGRYASPELTSGARRTWTWLRDFHDGRIRLEGAQPGREYPILICSSDASMGAVARVVPRDSNEPIGVQLQPTATIRGRLVRANGEPAADVGLYPSFFTNLADVPPLNDDDFDFRDTEYYNNFAGIKTGNTDADGRFEIAGFAADLPLVLRTNYALKSGLRSHLIGKLAPGEVRDLGDIVLAE